MSTSHIDSTDYGKGLQRALDIRGIRQAPDKVNVDQIQYIADAVQSGFAIKEFKSVSHTFTAVGPGSGDSYFILSPEENYYTTDDKQNNRLWETRLLGILVTVNIATPNVGQLITCRLRYYNVPNGSYIPFVEHCLLQAAGVTSYRFCFPNMVSDQTGTFQNYNGWSHQGYVPAGLALNRQVTVTGGYVANDTISTYMVWLRVPRGAHLPL